MVKRLNWGCGPIAPYGWVNSDISAYPGVDHVADIRQGLPFEANTFEYVVSIHALPELHYGELDRALKELHRVLQPGGVLRLSLPDLDRAIRAYSAGDIDYFLIPDEHVQSIAGKMIVQLTWYGRSRSFYTKDFIAELLKRNGFSNVTACSFKVSPSSKLGITELDDRELESIFVEATK